MSKPNPLRTVADLRRWFRENAEPEPSWDRAGRLHPRKWTKKNLDEALLWWFACWQAESRRSDLHLKDIASILLQGLPPLTLAQLQEELDSVHESEDESEPASEQIEAHLRQHFGLLTGEPGL